MMIDMESFGLKNGGEQEATLAVFEALRACKSAGEPVQLVFPKGRFHFRPEHATEKQLYITNHDQGGTRRIAFHLNGHSNLTIDGQHSEFIFHDSIIPFAMDRASRITCRRFTIDWGRPMFDQGIVADASDRFFDISLREGIAYEVCDGKLYFEYDGRMQPVWGLHEIDPKTMCHAYQSGDRLSWSSFKKLRIDKIKPGLVRVSGHLRHIPKIGNWIGMRFGRRENPGFFLKNSSDIQIEDVAVYHAPGMGLVAQRSENISLQRFDVRLKPGTDRVFSATADAVHFTNCRGLIKLEHCLFENQLDDPCNVHGIYAKVEQALSERTVVVKLMEKMTKGIEMAVAGDWMQAIDPESLLACGHAAEVESADLINSDYQVIRFKERLPEGLEAGRFLENRTWNPDLTVRHCTVRANRARGFLITTPGYVVLEHNTISAPGAAVKISGDANSWYESGAVKDVTIRNNRFLASNYCCPDWGKAVIDIDPEIRHPELYECYHSNIRIENNVFETFDLGIVSGHSVDGFTFRNNRIIRTDDYPAHGYMKHSIELKAVRNVDIAGNEAPEEYRSILLGTEIHRLD
jgi:hypothetical protein